MSVDSVKILFRYDTQGLSREELLTLYTYMVYARRVEEKMLVLLRQNKISKWFSGIGQEAIAVGATCALKKEDYIFPLHRNLGVFLARGMPLRKLFAQWQGKKSGYTQGRERSFHFGSVQDRVIGMISHLGAMLPVADGVALASKLKKQNFIVLAFIGEGATSEGDFHEALNLASVWDLPVLFLIENNGYALSTPPTEQYRCQKLSDKAQGYGIEGCTLEGNNVLEVYRKVKAFAEAMRQDHRPRLLECFTFRRRGHEEASGTKYVPPSLQAYWAERDPVENYEKFLLAEGILLLQEREEIEKKLKKEIDQAVQEVLSEPEPTYQEKEEIADVYHPSDYELVPPSSSTRPLRYVDAISEGLSQAMEKDPSLVLMGQDVAEYGGVFKVTEGFVSRFGKERVRNTPLCESAVLGAALGLSIENIPSVVEMQFSDFVSMGFNQIVNNLAKNHYRWGVPAKVVVRMPTGAGVGAGPFHSQSTEAWFMHVPGLKILYPATAYDAKGLLTTAIKDPNPVMFFEHKALYRKIQDLVPEKYYNLPIGVAKVAKEGKDLSLITYGWGLHMALQAQKNFPYYDIEIIDLRTLLPWDKETVLRSVRKCGRCLILYEGTYTLGVGAEIAAWLAEYAFMYLDAPIFRVASQDTPVPFNPVLEEGFLPWNRLPEAIERILRF
ncbi:MAG: alpha-ketoacid dehydrogenase subunit alpha/beta [Bacteroidia bacterium]